MGDKKEKIQFVHKKIQEKVSSFSTTNDGNVAPRKDKQENKFLTFARGVGDKAVETGKKVRDSKLVQSAKDAGIRKIEVTKELGIKTGQKVVTIAVETKDHAIAAKDATLEGDFKGAFKEAGSGVLGVGMGAVSISFTAAKVSASYTPAGIIMDIGGPIVKQKLASEMTKRGYPQGAAVLEKCFNPKGAITDYGLKLVQRHKDKVPGFGLTDAQQHIVLELLLKGDPTAVATDLAASSANRLLTTKTDGGKLIKLVEVVTNDGKLIKPSGEPADIVTNLREQVKQHVLRNETVAEAVDYADAAGSTVTGLELVEVSKFVPRHNLAEESTGPESELPVISKVLGPKKSDTGRAKGFYAGGETNTTRDGWVRREVRVPQEVEGLPTTYKITYEWVSVQPNPFGHDEETVTHVPPIVFKPIEGKKNDGADFSEEESFHENFEPVTNDDQRNLATRVQNVDRELAKSVVYEERTPSASHRESWKAHFKKTVIKGIIEGVWARYEKSIAYRELPSDAKPTGLSPEAEDALADKLYEVLLKGHAKYPHFPSGMNNEIGPVWRNAIKKKIYLKWLRARTTGPDRLSSNKWEIIIDAGIEESEDHFLKWYYRHHNFAKIEKDLNKLDAKLQNLGQSTAQNADHDGVKCIDLNPDLSDYSIVHPMEFETLTVQAHNFLPGGCFKYDDEGRMVKQIDCDVQYLLPEYEPTNSDESQVQALGSTHVDAPKTHMQTREFVLELSIPSEDMPDGSANDGPLTCIHQIEFLETAPQGECLRDIIVRGSLDVAIPECAGTDISFDESLNSDWFWNELKLSFHVKGGDYARGFHLLNFPLTYKVNNTTYFIEDPTTVKAKLKLVEHESEDE